VVGIFAMFPACGSADGNLKRCVDYASPGKDSTPEINVKTVKGDGRLHPSRDNSRNPFADSSLAGIARCLATKSFIQQICFSIAIR
jgi:hypothetical protein